MKTLTSIANPSNAELLGKFFTRSAALSGLVAQVSKPAVSPISKSAGRDNFKRVGLADGARVWKPAIQQTWKSALRAGFALLLLATSAARAVDYHVATAQALQNALTLAASDGANNNIYITNGYYIGNFNYNSAGGYNLTVTNEPGVTNTQITLDGGGNGRALSITSSGTSAITVAGITFSRNCGNIGIGALRIAGGAGSVILVNCCQFLSPSGSSGMGLEVAAGLNATVTNCAAAGPNNGAGLLITGIAGNVTVQSCSVSTNQGGGLYVSGASVIVVSNCVLTGNSPVPFTEYYQNFYSANGGGAYCSGTTIILSGNIFSGNNFTGIAGYYEGGSGGGAYCSGVTVNVTANSFIGNSANNGIGGGVECSGTTVTLSGNTFSGNSCNHTGGGGADGSGTTVTISGNNFIGNSSPVGIGGVNFSVTSLTLSGNNFAGNSGGTGNGGGANFYMGVGVTMSVYGNTFTDNSSSSGGGLYCVIYSGSMTLSNNAFTGNSGATGLGGGIYCYSSATNPITVLGNSFQQNNAATGGGIYASGPTVNVLDNLVAQNSQTSSSSQGGGVWVDATSNLFFINNTITGNTAAGSGGGAAFEATGTVELLNVYNNIIWGNLANGNGADVWLAGTGQKKIFDFNDVNNMYGVWDIAVNNTNVSPIFFNPVGGDYHLQNTSPCRNIGTNGAPGQPLTDLDGNVRTNSVGQIDLGCYEFNISATHPADTNASFVITPGEFAAYAAAWKAGQPWTNAPASAPNPIPIPANYVTRAGYLMTNGGAYTNDGSARPTNWKLAP